MAKYLLLIAALLCAGVANADNSKANAPVVIDNDGFKEPLSKLKFNPGLDQREFERSTLNALAVYDPLEEWNRRVYHFNYRFDQWVFLPVVDGYRYVTPSFLRTGVSNFFNNLGDVPNLVNSLLQLKGKRSMETSARLLLNTTIGIAGLWTRPPPWACRARTKTSARPWASTVYQAAPTSSCQFSGRPTSATPAAWQSTSP